MKLALRWRAVPTVWVAAAALTVPSGCFSQPVRVERRGEQALHADLDTCALHGNEPSARTAWILRLTELEDEYWHDPVGTLRTMHGVAVREDNRLALFAMAELAYLAGKRTGDRDCFLSASVYAYLYLLGPEGGPPPSPYGRRFRWACDIYNRSLMRALKSPDDGSLRLQAGPRSLTAGALELEVDLSAFPFETDGLELLPADELDVVGLDFRVRDGGLGAPLIALVQRRGEGTAGVGILDETSVSATLFLRIHGGARDMEDGLRGELELYSTYDQTEIEVADRVVPLEADTSATIAYGLQASDLWDFDLAGFFGGRDAMRQNGLILPRPFQAGRVPVVLVHGTASDPSKWAEMLNSLQADPVIRARVQFWLFIYTSGNPVIYSAASLREDLQAMVDLHDPEGRDAALRSMVVVGHSQGGLLTKLTAVHLDADEVSQQILGLPLEDLQLDEKEEQLLRRCLDVEPLPFVDRVVFLATPHRGSFLASWWISRFLARMIAVPGEVVNVSRSVVRRSPRDRLPTGMQKRVPTSLDNMDPKNRVLLLLADTPIDPRIRANSIIPIGNAEEPAGADDGVVEYESAHLEDVESEIQVPSGHSCQAHPRTLIEMRRILRRHLAVLDGAPAAAR